MTRQAPVVAAAVPDHRPEAMDPFATAVILVAIWIPIHIKLSRWIDQL